jgi:hypothetical protein
VVYCVVYGQRVFICARAIGASGVPAGVGAWEAVWRVHVIQCSPTPPLAPPPLFLQSAGDLSAVELVRKCQAALYSAAGLPPGGEQLRALQAPLALVAQVHRTFTVTSPPDARCVQRTSWSLSLSVSLCPCPCVLVLVSLSLCHCPCVRPSLSPSA